MLTVSLTCDLKPRYLESINVHHSFFKNLGPVIRRKRWCLAKLGEEQQESLTWEKTWGSMSLNTLPWGRFLNLIGHPGKPWAERGNGSQPQQKHMSYRNALVRAKMKASKGKPKTNLCIVGCLEQWCMHIPYNRMLSRKKRFKKRRKNCNFLTKWTSILQKQLYVEVAVADRAHVLLHGATISS